MAITQTNSSLPTKAAIQEHPIGTKLFDEFEIIEVIAHGGMSSIVYKVLNKKKEIMVIKHIVRTNVTTDDEWKKFLHECITVQRISGKRNIIRTFDVKHQENEIYIIMEYIGGTTLRKIIKKLGYIEVKETIYIFKKIVEAIVDIHSFNYEKIIHRDLKPENIMVSHDKTNVKIIDFGISPVKKTKALYDKENNPTKTKFITDEKNIYGTYPYICPDILKWKKTSDDEKVNLISEQFDFFSLGVILYEMLIGTKPFTADNYESVSVIRLPLKYDINCLHEINNNIPNALENIIFRCLASKDTDLKYRYHNAQEILEDIVNVENNFESSFKVSLIKPMNKRILQIPELFSLDKEMEKIKWYESVWFYMVFLFLLIVIILSILMIYHAL